jgi:hypothetical protein
MDTRCGTRKAHKNQTGDHRQPEHAHHDLEREITCPERGELSDCRTFLAALMADGYLGRREASWDKA